MICLPSYTSFVILPFVNAGHRVSQKTSISLPLLSKENEYVKGKIYCLSSKVFISGLFFCVDLLLSLDSAEPLKMQAWVTLN